MESGRRNSDSLAEKLFGRAEQKACGVKSVRRAVKILETLGVEEGMSVTEISRKLDLPKSSVHEILTTLAGEGVLEKDHENSRYYLGLKLVELGTRAQSNLEVRRIATPHLKELNRNLDETVHLTVLDNGEVLYVECFESSKRLRTYSVIGVRAPLHCTAVGKAILAFLEKDEIEEIIKGKGLARFTENTITDRNLLMAELEKIVRLGYAVDNMEHEEGVCCVGAPIRNHEGRVFASISISGPSQRITSLKMPEIGKLLISKVDDISKKLGYRPKPRGNSP